MKRADGEKSQSEAAYEQIEQMIVVGALKSGEMISEQQLSEELGYGRTPIREALQRLKLEGYIEVMASRGAMVAPTNILTQLDLLEVRRPLEAAAVDLGAQRATTEQRQTLRNLVRDLQAAADANDLGAFLTANRALHSTIQETTQNAVLASTIRVIYGLSRRFWYGALTNPENMKTAAQLHGATYNAVAAGEPLQAVAAATKFIDFLEVLTREATERRSKVVSAHRVVKAS